MERLRTIFITISLMLIIINVDTGIAAAPVSVTLHFYTQGIKSGQNTTRYGVANASITSESPTLFGHVGVFDEKVTVGPELDSAEVGSRQGFGAFADMQVTALSHVSNFVFTPASKYNASTITVVGRNVAGENGELAVAGGTGAFRNARGYATTRIYMETEIRLVSEIWIFINLN